VEKTVISEACRARVLLGERTPGKDGAGLFRPFLSGTRSNSPSSVLQAFLTTNSRRCISYYQAVRFFLCAGTFLCLNTLYRRHFPQEYSLKTKVPNTLILPNKKKDSQLDTCSSEYGQPSAPTHCQPQTIPWGPRSGC